MPVRRLLLLGCLVVVPAFASVDCEALLDADTAAENRKEVRHQHLLIADALSGRTDARSLVMRGLLARGVFVDDQVGPQFDSAEVVLQAALQNGRGDPLVAWLLTQQRWDGALLPLAAEATDALVEADPGNAAAWLAQLELREDTLTDSEVDALLARAAKARQYHLYYGDTVRLATAAVAELPRLSALEALTCDMEPTEAARLMEDSTFPAFMHGFGIAMALQVPSFGTASKACRSAAPGSERRATCYRLGALMAAHTDTMIGEQIGTRLMLDAADTDAERARAQVLRRDFAWQSAAYGELLLERDPVLGLDWPRTGPMWLAEGSSEISIRTAVLREAGVSLQAPPSFVSQHEQVEREQPVAPDEGR